MVKGSLHKQESRLKTLYNYAVKAFVRYKFQISTLTFLGFLSGILEGIGINALIPLLSFTLNRDVVGDDFITKKIEQFFNFFEIDFSMRTLLIFIVVLFVVKATITVYLEYIKIKITSDYEQDTRQELFSSLLKSNWSHLIKQKLGHLETVLMIDVPAAANLLQQISASIMIMTSLIIYVLFALSISTTVTLFTLLLGAITFLIFKRFFAKTRQLASKKVRLNKEVAHLVNENVYGIKTVKVMHVTKPVIKRAANLFEKLRSIMIRMSLMRNVTAAIIHPLGVIYIVGIFAYAYKAPGFEVTLLAPLIYLIYRIFSYVQQLQRSVHGFNEFVPHLRSVLTYEREAKQNQETAILGDDYTFEKKLSFENVSFAYTDKTKVLNNLSFEIKKGDFIGLIGPSGAGKTTIVDLVLRLLTPSQGAITIDDKPTSKISLEQWRNNIGYVSQDIFLMNDTIENNIRFYDETITKTQMQEAAKMANIHEFIEQTPDKYQTKIGERGIMLSAGQRQRIVIARILARKPDILVLDEATSALDNESEVEIQKVIKNLKGKITVLAIAHRLSTVMDSDKLLVLENGSIQETGDPKALMEDKDSYFYKVYTIRN